METEKQKEQKRNNGIIVGVLIIFLLAITVFGITLKIGGYI